MERQTGLEERQTHSSSLSGHAHLLADRPLVESGRGGAWPAASFQRWKLDSGCFVLTFNWEPAANWDTGPPQPGWSSSTAVCVRVSSVCVCVLGHPRLQRPLRANQGACRGFCPGLRGHPRSVFVFEERQWRDEEWTSGGTDTPEENRPARLLVFRPWNFLLRRVHLEKLELFSGGSGLFDLMRRALPAEREPS